MVSQTPNAQDMSEVWNAECVKTTAALLFSETCGRMAALANPKSSTAEVKAALENIVEDDNVHDVNLTGTQGLDWTELQGSLCNLICRKDTAKVMVPAQVRGIVRGRCKGQLLKEFSTQLAGKNISLAGTVVELAGLATEGLDRLLDKICSPEDEDPDLQATLRYLTVRLKTEACPGPNLSAAVFRACKILRKNKNVKPRLKRSKGKTPVNHTYDKGATCSDMIEDDDGPPDVSGCSSERLPRHTVCYVCNLKYPCPLSPAQQQYPRLCPECALFNLEKRNQHTDLTGFVAIVTGARVKIGYQVALKLLRDGCRVIATTRFPHDAARRYAQEADFNNWKSNLRIYPLDLMDIQGLFVFIKFVQDKEGHIDILINNAAQTIRRPMQFYRHLLPKEQTPRDHLPDAQQHLVATDITLNYGHSDWAHLEKRDTTGLDLNYASMKPITLIENTKKTQRTNKRKFSGPIPTKASTEHLVPEACLSENEGEVSSKDYSSEIAPDEIGVSPAKCLKLSPPESELPINKSNVCPKTDLEAGPGPSSTEVEITTVVPSLGGLLGQFFPTGQLDADGQQVDLRPVNSWSAELEDVPLSEMLEVLLVNAVAPFLLVKELRPLLNASPHPRRFVINVSAMEGQFSRKTKTRFHPHTNMAKAALNMLTRTSALGLKEQGIYMTAVDTGWVTDERPAHQAAHEARTKGFVVPLDVVDGAARVYHPVVAGLTSSKEPHYAVFLKNYKPHPW